MSENLFGVLLHRHRQARGLSQPKLAELAGYDHSYVSRLEAPGSDKVRRRPSRDAVTNLCRALKLTGDEETEFFLAAGYLPNGEFYPPTAPPEVRRLLDLLAVTTARQRELLLRAVDAVTEMYLWEREATSPPAVSHSHRPHEVVDPASRRPAKTVPVRRTPTPTS